MKKMFNLLVMLLFLITSITAINVPTAIAGERALSTSNDGSTETTITWNENTASFSNDLITATEAPTSASSYCNQVTVHRTAGGISVSGLLGSWKRISYRHATAASYTEACSDNCGTSHQINGLPAGDYVVRIEQSDGGYTNYCHLEIAAKVTGTINYCNNVKVVGKEGKIRVTGLGAAGWRRIEYRVADKTKIYEVCSDNCTDPFIIPNLAAGEYVVRVEQSDGGSLNHCVVEIAAKVTSPAIDYCGNVKVVGKEGKIRVTGLGAAGWRRIEYRAANKTKIYEVCSDNCTDPFIIRDLAAGEYVVRVEQSDGGSLNHCVVEIAAIVTDPYVDYCAGVAASGGVGKFSVSGVTAPWNKIQYRYSNSSTYYEVCNDNCGNPQSLSNVPAGTYVVKIEQSDNDNKNYCYKEITVIVTAPYVDYCAGVAASGGVGKFSVSGVTAPWNKIQYRYSNSSTYYEMCNDNCGNPQSLSNVPAGTYVVKIEQSNNDSKNYCYKEITVIVTSPRIDYCGSVSVVGGVGKISVSGVHAPWNKILYRKANSSTYYTACNDNCGNIQGLSNVPAGTYVIKVEQSDNDGKNYCFKEITAVVTNPYVDYCGGVSASGGVGKITVNGVAAPWHKILYRKANSSTYYTACNDNCGNPQGLTNVPAGTYVIKVEQSDNDGKNYCFREITVIVTSPRIEYCGGVSASGGVGKITVNGVAAPWHKILYRKANSSTYYTACNDNCGNPQSLINVPAGTYVIKVEQSDNDGKNYCFREITVIVTSPHIDYCGGVSVSGGVGKITVNGVAAPWNKILYRKANSATYYTACNDNCGNPQGLTNVPAGTYVIKVEQSDNDGKNYCFKEITVVVTSPYVDYCAGVSASGGEEKITVSGVHAPWHRIQYRYATSATYYTLCDDNCGNPQSLTNVPAGSYVLRVEQSDGGNKNYCVVDIVVTVTATRASGYCSDVTITPGVQKITIEGVNAPWNKIKFKGPSTNNQFKTICNDNCYIAPYNQIIIGDLWAGHYTVITEESNGSTGYCKVEKTIYVSGQSLTEDTAGSRNSDSTPSNSTEVAPEPTIEWETNTHTVAASDPETLAALSKETVIDDKAVTLFPNPVQEELQVDLKAFAGKKATIVIVNQIGAVVEQLMVEELTESPVRIDVSSQATGLYFMRATIDDSGLITKKFMISKR